MFDVSGSYENGNNSITLTISSQTAQSATVRVLDEYTGKSIEAKLKPGESMSKRWLLARFSGWYGFVITVDQDPGFEHQIAGHVETGEDSISDPAMGGLV